jgi:hypothetical protein
MIVKDPQLIRCFIYMKGKSFAMRASQNEERIRRRGDITGTARLLTERRCFSACWQSSLPDGTGSFAS